ncbi:MAG: hypothetical protein JKX94_01220 [Sneathiella sp.]|nr:hypothetical protein [Sneathiella sp.]
MKFSKEDIKAMRHPSEKSRFLLTIFVLLPLGLIGILATVASFGGLLILIPIVLFGLWFTTRFFSAMCMNNMVLISNRSFPDIFDAINDAKEAFDYKGHIDAYVYQADSFNMLMMPKLRRKVILVNSAMVDGVDHQKEIRFVVGRFVGALVAKHYRFFWLKGVLSSIEKLMIFNLLLYPYERSLQYTGDQLGLSFIGGDSKTAIRVFKKFIVGPEISDMVRTSCLLEQMELSKGSFFAWMTRAFSSFPHLTYRIDNIQRFVTEQYPKVRAQMEKTEITADPKSATNTDQDASYANA